MKKIWVNRASSFKKALGFDENYYFSMSQGKRLETMQLLRKLHYKMKRTLKNNGRRERLRRVIKIIQ